MFYKYGKNNKNIKISYLLILIFMNLKKYVSKNFFKFWFWSKSLALKTLLNNGKTNFIMEAHNGISAKIVE